VFAGSCVELLVSLLVLHIRSLLSDNIYFLTPKTGSGASMNSPRVGDGDGAPDLMNLGSRYVVLQTRLAGEAVDVLEAALFRDSFAAGGIRRRPGQSSLCSFTKDAIDEGEALIGRTWASVSLRRMSTGADRLLT
jgi:hypothetical protein